MPDRISKKQRSANMSAVRAKDNKTTELRIIKLFKTNQVTGWRRHTKTVPGKPDFLFPRQKVAIFVDGCFWHGCKKCSNLQPKSNRTFWIPKLKSNQERDKKINKELKTKNWKVVRIWEHQLKKPEVALRRIKKELCI